MRRISQIIALLTIIFIGYYFLFLNDTRNRFLFTNKDGGNFSSIEIIGTDEFIVQTTNALNLLKENSPEAFIKVHNYIGVIEQGKRSAMWAYQTPPRFEVSDRVAFYSETWYATVIAHESIHSEMFHTYIDDNDSDVPNHIWKGPQAERLCFKYQLAVSQQIGSPQNEINKISIDSNDGRHCDIDKDGDCDWFDYLKRNW